jgi:hypothetical protein
MKVHMVRKHPEENLINHSYSNVASNAINIAEKSANISNNASDISNNALDISAPILTESDNKCSKCSRVLISKKTLKSHMKICKGTSNSLQCHNCYQIFSNACAKCRHLKTCLSQALIVAPETQPIPVTTTNNTTNNNIGRDQNNTINNNISQTNNITILTVDPNKIDELEFITDHITNPQLKSILKLTHRDESDAKKVNMLETYVRQLMANPANKCIQKSNMQNVYSQIHTGDNKWETKHDKDLYPKLTCNVAQGFSGLMTSRHEDVPMIKTERKLGELKAFLDYMADEGYRNDSDEKVNHQTHLIFKELVQRIKSVVFDITKVNI